MRAALSLAAFFVILAPTSGFGDDQQPPNVLFLAIDDLNTWLVTDPDRYTGKIIAPNIRALAESGTLFHNAYTASSLCSPSRTAFLSGVAPWNSGVYGNGTTVMESPALQAAVSLPKVFKDAGYYMASFGKISHGYSSGIDWDANQNHSRDPAPPNAPLNGIALSKSGKLTERDWGATHLAEEDMNDTKYADLAIKALQREHTTPFFIACGLFHPHYPWYVPQKYLDMYPLEDIVLPPVKDDDLEDVPEMGRAMAEESFDAKIKEIGHTKKAIQAYLGCISYVDHQMGRVLKALDESGHRDNTIVVLISDHGYHVAEKQTWFKATLWEEATDVLMTWRAPGVTTPGQVCTRTVSLLDLYPTLTELAGLATPNHVDGHSLVPLLKDSQATWSHPAISALNESMAVRTEDHRFIRYKDGTTELYDRTKDPNEWINLADNPEYASVKAAMNDLLPSVEEMAPAMPRKVKKKK